MNMETTGSDISGIGVDIEQISRFSEKPYEQNKRLYDKMFTAGEIAYCTSKRDPYPHFTARFCAKEALAKALDGIMRLDWHEVEVATAESGRPCLCFKTNSGEKNSQLLNMNFFLSLSHDRTQAVAFVIVSVNKQS